MQHRQGHWTVHYLLAVLVVVLTILLRRLLDPLLHERLPLIAQFAAVTFVAWYAGRGPAIAALLLGTFAAAYFLLEPRGSLSISHTEDIFGLIIFSILQIGSIVLFDQLQRARDRAELQAQEIRQQYEELQDATRRRRDAEARALSEGERLKVTLASIGDAVITTDRDGLVTFLNEIAIRLTGWSLEEARGVPLETVFQIVNETTREPVDNPALRSLREGSIVGLANHTVLIAKDGSECPIDDSAAPIRDQDGNIFGSVLVFRDISDRKQVERHRNVRLAVTSALNQSREPQAGVAGVLAAVCENLGWEVGFFWKVGQAPNELSCDTTWTRSDAPLEDFVKATCSRSFRRGEGLPGRVWESAEPAWILDIAEDPNFPRLNVARNHGLRSAMACPVKEGEETLGVVEFFTGCIRDADPDLLELMGTVAGHLGQFLERKQAELELKESEEELSDFFENASVGLHSVGPDGVILRANQAELDLLGYTREEYVGQAISNFYVDPNVIHEILQRLSQGERLTEHPAQLRCKDGTVKDVLIDSSVMFRGTQFVHTRCFTRDVTEKKRAERELRAAQRRFEAVFNQQFQFMAILAPDGRILEANETCFRATGIPRERIVGQIAWETPWWDGLPVVQQQLREQVAAAARTGRPVTGEMDYCLADGSLRHATTVVSGLKDETGAVTHLVMEGQDDTERKRGEQILAAQKRVLELLVHDAPLPNVLDALCEVIEGQSRQRLIATILLTDDDGQHLRSVAGWRAPPEYAQAVDGVAIGAGMGSCGTAAFERRQVIVTDIATDPLWANFKDLALGHGLRACWSTPILSSQGKVLGTFAVYYRTPRAPSTDERQLVEILTRTAGVAIERRLSEAALRDADRRKDEFLAMLAHELRNPLAPISNGLQVLRLSGADSSAANNALSMMERQLGQLVRLVDDLLDVSRITRNKLDLRKQRVDLAAIVNSAVETSRPLIEHAGHAFTVSIPQQPIFLEADLTRVAQVLSNLLNNSAKYTEPGGQIELRAAIEGDQVAITVRDNGLGIPAEALSRIFEMFSQVDLNLDRAQGGLGIGLTLVRRLVEMHGGTVEARSDGPGKGSEFIVRLPILVDGGNGQVDAAAASREATAIHKQRILIIDDNHDAATSLGMMLKLMGNETYTAHDGLAGVEAAASYRPNIILLDIGLPKLNGYDACRQIRAQPWSKGMVIVALTGWGQDEDRRRSAEAGFDHHLVKPVEVDALARLLGGH